MLEETLETKDESRGALESPAASKEAEIVAKVAQSSCLEGCLQRAEEVGVTNKGDYL